MTWHAHFLNIWPHRHAETPVDVCSEVPVRRSQLRSGAIHDWGWQGCGARRRPGLAGQAAALGVGRGEGASSLHVRCWS